MPKTALKVHIRWMIRRDMPETLAIEAASFEAPWGEEEFLQVLRQRSCIGMVAEHGERIVGFMLYELHKSKIQILNFCVHPEYRRQGIGAQMAQKLTAKLSAHRRTRILLHVRETNLDAQRFFRAQGYRATEVVRGHFEDTDEDAYVMEYQLEEAAEPAPWRQERMRRKD